MSHLAQLSQLLDNPWWKHFIAECVKERERTRNGVCDFPITNLAQMIMTLQIRGEATAYDNVTKLLYDKYNELVNLAKEQEAEQDTKGVTNE